MVNTFITMQEISVFITSDPMPSLAAGPTCSSHTVAERSWFLPPRTMSQLALAARLVRALIILQRVCVEVTCKGADCTELSGKRDL